MVIIGRILQKQTMKGGYVLPGENEKGMGDAGQGSEKSQVKRFFFQEKKLLLQPGPTGKDKRTNYISDLPYFPPFRLLSHSVTKQKLWPGR